MTRIWAAKVDITTIEVDAIVCAANVGLVLGCGVAGFIWRRGGPEIQEECDRLGKVKPGDVAVTTAGRLPAKYVFHAVSMGYQHPDVAALLTGVTTKCLEEAARRELKSIAFPAIAAGRMKLSPQKSCEYMARAIAEFDFDSTTIDSAGFALLDEAVYGVFASELPGYILGDPGLEFSLEAPQVVDMPWRSF